MSNEPLGIVEEGQRRSSIFSRFIDRRVERALSEPATQMQINAIVDARVRAEVEAIVARRLEQQRLEFERVMEGTNRRAMKIRDFIELACRVTGADYDEIVSPRRYKRVSEARAFAWWLIRRYRGDLSMPAIGRAFERDHSTISHGLKKVSQRRAEQPFAAWFAHPEVIALDNPTALMGHE